MYSIIIRRKLIPMSTVGKPKEITQNVGLAPLFLQVTLCGPMLLPNLWNCSAQVEQFSSLSNPVGKEKKGDHLEPPVPAYGPRKRAFTSTSLQEDLAEEGRKVVNCVMICVFISPPQCRMLRVA